MGLGLDDRASLLRKESFTTPVPENKRIRRSFRAPEGDWRRVDIHLHTPASADWLDPGSSYLQWLQKAESRGLDIVAITDHNTVEGVARLRAEVERLAWLEANDRLRPQERRDLDEYRRLGDKILVLPGFEFTATFGFHILGVFPPETALRKLELLLLRLNVPMDRLSEGVTEVGPTTDVITAYRVIREAGGLVIAAHANSTHGVALQGMSFGGQTRIAFTQDPNLHALEVTDLESASRRATWRFFDGSKPEYPRRMHLLQGSDAHRLTRDPKDKNRMGVGDRVTEIMLPEVSFDALRAVLEGNDFTLMRPYRPPAEEPFDHVQAALEQGSNIVQAFHGSLSRDGGGLQRVLCDVVAFANTRGGTVYVGVTDRNGPKRGLEAPDLAVQLLKKEIERNVTPPLDVTVDLLTTQGVPVLRAVVPNGADKPYALGQTRVYIREESETNEAVRDELVQLVRGSLRVAEAQPQVEEPTAVTPPSESAVLPSVRALPVTAERAAGRRMPAPERPGQAVEPPQEEPSIPLPSIGVELVSMDERKGGRYFSIRDLRNGNVVQNVTIHSARKLWSYAINQHLTHGDGPDNVTWRGDLGLWQAARRAKKLRYDLALRMPDGKVRVFYGVTADGMTGSWAQFLLAEDRPEGEMETVPPAIIIAEEPDEEREGETPEPADILAPPENGDREPDAVAKSRSRRGHRGGRGRSKSDRSEAGIAEPEVVASVEAASTSGPVVESEQVVVAPAEPEAPVTSKPRSRTRKPKAGIAAQPPAPPAQPAPQDDSEGAVPESPAPGTRSRSRTKKQGDISASAAITETTDVSPIAEALAVIGDDKSLPKPALAAQKASAPRKPKAQQAEPARTMPEAIGQTPKRRTRKPKQEPVAE